MNGAGVFYLPSLAFVASPRAFVAISPLLPAFVSLRRIRIGSTCYLLKAISAYRFRRYMCVFHASVRRFLPVDP